MDMAKPELSHVLARFISATKQTESCTKKPSESRTSGTSTLEGDLTVVWHLISFRLEFQIIGVPFRSLNAHACVGPSFLDGVFSKGMKMSDSRLSRIETQWSLVHKANTVEPGAANAQSELFERYSPAVKRYLLASLRNQEAADEVFQEFALRIVRGDFRNADFEKGRFRNMIKTSLYRLMVDHYRGKQKRNKLGTTDQIDFVAANSPDSDTDEFTIAWRQTILDKAWEKLEHLQMQSTKPYFTILRARVDHPELTTKQLHEHLQESQPVQIPAEGSFRVYLHRARRKFATLLTEQVSLSIEEPTPENVEAELIDLGLHSYCRP